MFDIEKLRMARERVLAQLEGQTKLMERAKEPETVSAAAEVRAFLSRTRQLMEGSGLLPQPELAMNA